MKLKDCKLGILVKSNLQDTRCSKNWIGKTLIPAIGHIVGLDLNSDNEINIKVQMADGEIVKFHPDNISPL